ncbi:MAG: DUF4250 domain-containing protein [Clostridia bacterium]|nr:DUF4250 domain-containing protein [Clostridia bacterium]
MDLPQDDFILLSFINTKLRDEYSSLDELCDSLDIPCETILSRLDNLGYTYDEDKNAFTR